MYTLLYRGSTPSVSATRVLENYIFGAPTFIYKLIMLFLRKSKKHNCLEHFSVNVIIHHMSLYYSCHNNATQSG
jgi:hypothetical protein